MAETFTWFAVVIIIAVAPASAGGVLVAKAYSPLLRSMGFWSIGLGALVLLLGFLVGCCYCLRPSRRLKDEKLTGLSGVPASSPAFRYAAGFANPAVLPCVRLAG